VRNRELEARIVAHPEDDESWSVYADWLESHGDPRGEVLAIAMRAEKARDPKLELIANARLIRHAPQLCGGLVETFRVGSVGLPEGVGWRRGFANALRFDPGTVTRPLAEAVRAAFAEEACAFVTDVVIRNSLEAIDGAILALAEAAPASVREVVLSSGANIADVTPLFALANLVRLRCTANDDGDGHTPLSALVAHAAAPWPLRILDVKPRATPETAAALARLFARADVPLTDVTIAIGGGILVRVPQVEREAREQFASTVCRAIVASPLAHQIQRLYLHLPFSRDDYQQFVKHVGRFTSLHSIVLPSRTFTKKLEVATIAQRDAYNAMLRARHR